MNQARFIGQDRRARVRWRLFYREYPFREHGVYFRDIFNVSMKILPNGRTLEDQGVD